VDLVPLAQAPGRAAALAAMAAPARAALGGARREAFARHPLSRAIERALDGADAEGPWA
jgi:hypothetical protein